MGCSMTLYSKDSLNRLHVSIQDELAVIDELIALLKEQQVALVNHELKKIEQLTAEEFKLAGRMTSVEAQRLIATIDVGRDHSFNAENVTLGELVSILKLEDEPDGIPQLSVELSEKLDILVRLNFDNKVLTQNLLEYTDLVVRTIALEKGQSRYNRKGGVDEGDQSRPILDDRI